ncbi:unnamed protein product [Discula destructiva]
MAFVQAVAPAAGFISAAPLTTTAPIPGLELRADATTSSVAALTTTFTAPSSCYDDLLTMLTAKSYQIWINEPLPLPGTMLGECYPSEWSNGYTSVVGSSSSIAPMMSPLVCPSGWNTQSDDKWSSGYIACCASGFTLAPPTSTLDSDRPAYGGTCYSNFALGAVETVTVYNSTALSMTTAWTATTTPAQAYAHPIDGIAADYTPTSTTPVGYTGGASASTSTADSDSGAARLGGREVGSGIAGALLAASVVVFFL